MTEYEQIKFFICCMECHDEILWGQGYYKFGDYVFCEKCLPNVADILLHCRHLKLGSEDR